MALHDRWGHRKLKAARHALGEAVDKGAVVKTIQQEAKAAGATLKNDGKGGLDPRLALKVFRRAKYRCENEDCPDPKTDLDLDHASGHPKEIKADPKARKDPKLRAAAASKDPKDDEHLHVICAACHDRVHDRERAIESGKKPKPMRGAA